MFSAIFIPKLKADFNSISIFHDSEPVSDYIVVRFLLLVVSVGICYLVAGYL